MAPGGDEKLLVCCIWKVVHILHSGLFYRTLFINVDLNRDFYTKERMLRFGMSRDDACTRCGEIETYRHLFWECKESQRVWASNAQINSSSNWNYNLHYLAVKWIGISNLSFSFVFSALFCIGFLLSCQFFKILHLFMYENMW